MNNIKEDINVLEVGNRDTMAKIKGIEDELEETDEEADDANVNTEKKNQEGQENVLKCDNRDFTWSGTITYKKHMITKHPTEPDRRGAKLCSNTANINDTSMSCDEEYDFNIYSVEIEGDEIVDICNLCNTGLDNENKLRDI